MPEVGTVRTENLQERANVTLEKIERAMGLLRSLFGENLGPDTVVQTMLTLDDCLAQIDDQVGRVSGIANRLVEALGVIKTAERKGRLSA